MIDELQTRPFGAVPLHSRGGDGFLQQHLVVVDHPGAYTVVHLDPGHAVLESRWGAPGPKVVGLGKVGVNVDDLAAAERGWIQHRNIHGRTSGRGIRKRRAALPPTMSALSCSLISM